MTDKQSKFNIQESFPDEADYFYNVKTKLTQAINEAKDNLEKHDKDYRDFQAYMVDNRSEIDPHEMFQNTLLLKQTDGMGAHAEKALVKLLKLESSPYFARIDFRTNAETESKKYYLGRFSLNHGTELLVIDWRAPVAGMFYDYETGPASYVAPVGKVEGELTRKRQFRIKNGEMEFVLESSLNIQDDILQQELSNTSDEKMKSIISTIQKEQNTIIRDETTKTLIIQGVAGSGKTSIALHRLAYLLYRAKDKLSAGNVTIISPNKVFADYISNVLPELGEERIYGIGFKEIADIQLKGIVGIEPERDLLDPDRKGYSERAKFKASYDFLRLLDDYCKSLPERIFSPSEYRFGSFIAPAEWIKKRFDVYKSDPIKLRLKKIADDIYDQFDMSNHFNDALPKKSAMLKNLTAMLTVKNTMALYKKFYKATGNADKFVLGENKALEWQDVFPFLYIHAAFDGLRSSKIIKHLVIDEMQDYTPVQYAVINQLFPCQKTILGDFGQLADPNLCSTLADMSKLFPDAETAVLNKSYRSTYEIISFAKRLQPTAELEAVKRHGNEPEIIAAEDTQAELTLIKKLIEKHKNGANNSLGIIVKTNSKAKELHEMLCESYDITLIAPDSKEFNNGVSITSVQMSKGLEFDEVIITSVNTATYNSEHDRKLLYIAVTRAMHRLTLTYSGKLTELIC